MLINSNEENQCCFSVFKNSYIHVSDFMVLKMCSYLRLSRSELQETELIHLNTFHVKNASNLISDNQYNWETTVRGGSSKFLFVLTLAFEEG